MREKPRTPHAEWSGAAPAPAAATVHDEAVAAAVSQLAGVTLALLAGDEATAHSLAGGAERKRVTVQRVLAAYDVCASGTLSREEAQALFTSLARSIVSELAASGASEVARAHAQRILEDDERGTIARVASKLLQLADLDGDGRVSLTELAGLFEAVQRAQHASSDTFPQPLRALAGSLQLLPPTEGTAVSEAERAAEWHIGIPGDDHTLRRVEIGRELSVVGLGRSADASAYFLPELGLSLQPRCVLLTHGHRDHTAALPAMARRAALVLAPRAITGLAQLNFGDAAQTDEETVAALGDFRLESVGDGDEARGRPLPRRRLPRGYAAREHAAREQVLLPKEAYAGSPTPLGVQVFDAPHKRGIPAVAYGVYRVKRRLKQEYAALPKHELGALLAKDVPITEARHEGLLFYSGDTTIELLRARHADILPKYPAIIHEVTFFGKPSPELDQSVRQKGHTHYAQLHPFICAFPETTFICVHWSLRYSREDILGFFNSSYGGVPKNVVLWV
ncbi:hypothetical protein EMIHUDRAFT_212273 [Emiliania huxleyi CCMP1516]|uniref:EF-hand domain-containing protein n=2 Tax=Emiliania huxleyi TaxID=2903 RepID=A0A0D3IR95_EMIH1|nr:hypothetical protein EMIHUDRAFT_212273 [Emiliania huxleyi CCMP1516]EOD13780.1 hypothetical protein EMIHUDRAFT_212273 [Emiliania huxleyi CCMP1516]|eukprot:XP_005766209.1 hypothetical protein EMIHUDRAFT_212273 [Emiliania huxleyi CCMP1516]